MTNPLPHSRARLKALKSNRGIRAHMDGLILKAAKDYGAITTTLISTLWNASRLKHLPPLNRTTAHKRIYDLIRMGILVKVCPPGIYALKNTLPTRLQVGHARCPLIVQILAASPGFHFSSGKLQQLLPLDTYYGTFIRDMKLLARLQVAKRVSSCVWTLHPDAREPYPADPADNLTVAGAKRQGDGVTRNTPPYLKALRREYGVDQAKTPAGPPHGNQPAIAQDFDPFR